MRVALKTMTIAGTALLCCLLLPFPRVLAGTQGRPPPEDPFQILMEAAEAQAAEAKKTPGRTAAPTFKVKALPAALRHPVPTPAPKRSALHRRVLPDGSVVYECDPPQANPDEVEP